MGEVKCGPVRLSFNPQLQVEFRGATVTSDAGLLLPRELERRARGWKWTISEILAKNALS